MTTTVFDFTIFRGFGCPKATLDISFFIFRTKIKLFIPHDYPLVQSPSLVPTAGCCLKDHQNLDLNNKFVLYFQSLHIEINIIEKQNTVSGKNYEFASD